MMRLYEGRDYSLSSRDAPTQANRIRSALRCARQGCPCAKPGPRGPTHCPAHDDGHPSLYVNIRDGRVLLRCYAGCAQEQVIAALRARGLWPEPNGDRAGVTLADLAAAKRLPIEFLRGLGVHDVRLRTGSAVAVPYYGENGEEVAIRYRIALRGDRFRWKEGSRVIPYGLWRLREWRGQHRYILLVEGESDCWTAWHHGIPAIGIPGKSTWRKEWARHLDGLEVWVWQEPGAEDLVARIAHDIPQARVLVAPDGTKDLSESHLRGEDVRVLIERLREGARTAAEIAREASDSELRRLREQARPVLEHPDPLELFAESARRMGYAGDLRPALITYLAATTRLLQLRAGQMPAHTCLVGPSSAGKSYTWHVVRAHLPEDAVVEIEAGSPRALIYKDADLRHRVVAFAEVDSLPRGEDNPAASAVRHLLQEHRLRYEVVVRNPETGDFAVREVDRPGPTLMVTTAVRGPGGQLGTRLWLLQVPDDEARLREILQAQGELEEEGAAGPDEALRAYQACLQRLSPWDVVVPYARALARLLARSIVGPRVLRDFQRLLALVKAAAVLRHPRRQRDARGRLVADLEDYATVRELVDDMYATTAAGGATDLVRAVVRAVREAKDEGVERITYGEVARRLGLRREQVRRAAEVALRAGWLINRSADRKGAWAALEPGDPPPERVGLPLAEDVAQEWGHPPLSSGDPCDVVTFARKPHQYGPQNVTGDVTSAARFVTFGPEEGAGPPTLGDPGMGERQTSQSAPPGRDVWARRESALDVDSSQTSQRHSPTWGIEEDIPDILPDPEAGPPPWEDPDPPGDGPGEDLARALPCGGCGAPVAVLGGRPTCSRCGWPRNRLTDGRP